MRIFFKSIALAITLLSLNACKVNSQQTNNKVKIEDIKIYKYFENRGFTTVGAYTHFDDMKKNGVETIMIIDEDMKRLEQILNTAQRKKHFQTKFGINNIFCEIIFDSQNNSKSRAIISIGTDVSSITDLTDRKDYIVKNPSDMQWLSDFVVRIKITSEKK